MWDREILTASQLYHLAAKTDPGVGCKTSERKENEICFVCGTAGFSKGLRQKNLDSYGEQQALFDGMLLCPWCAAIWGNKAMILAKFAFFWHGKKNSGIALVLPVKGEGEKIKEEKRKILDLMLNPPEGYFTFAANRDSTNGTHFAEFGIVSFNPGKIQQYYMTVSCERNQPVLVDIPFLKDYIHAIAEVGGKIEGVDHKLRVNYVKRKEYFTALDRFEKLGIKAVIKNIEAIKVVNRLLISQITTAKAEEKEAA